MAPPVNDDWVNATQFGISGAIGHFTSGNSFRDVSEATIQPGEPGPGTHSIWYKFTVSAAGVMRLRTSDPDGTGIDTVLSVYTGSSLGALTELAANDNSSDPDSNGPLLSLVRLNVTPGVTYYVRTALVGGTGYYVGTGYRLEPGELPPPASTLRPTVGYIGLG